MEGHSAKAMPLCSEVSLRNPERWQAGGCTQSSSEHSRAVQNERSQKPSNWGASGWLWQLIASTGCNLPGQTQEGMRKVRCGGREPPENLIVTGTHRGQLPNHQESQGEERS